MKKKILILLCCIFITILVLANSFNNINNEIVLKDEHNTRKFTSFISMMYETGEETGIYEESKDNTWPTSGYTFNSVLSKCENGSDLSWNDNTKKVVMKGNVSDKCYVYFDVYNPTISKECVGKNFSQCIKDNYKLDSNIYYHNSSLENGAGDNSYRYAGSYKSVNNYICFGSDTANCPHDNMYRIIGVFGSQLKLIKADYAKSSELGTNGDYKGTYTNDGTSKGKNALSQIGVYCWNYNNGVQKSSDNWANSNLNKVNLNQTYLNSLGSTWAGKIATTAWKVGGNTFEKIIYVPAQTAYQNEIVSPETATTYNAKIGLLYASDYGFAASPNAWTEKLSYYYRDEIPNNNWLYGGLGEWTITRASDGTTNYDRAYTIFNTGMLHLNQVWINTNAVRPVFYLNSNITLTSGNGTYSNPYRIS